MSNFQWFFSDANGQQQGPVAGDVIAAHVGSGALAHHSMVWRDGLSAWVPLAQVLQDIGLAPAMPPPVAPPAPTPPPVTPPPALQVPPPAAAAPSMPPAGFHPTTGAMGHASRANPPADGESLATFVGTNWDLYARKWNAADATGNKHGWNWPAFLLGPIWIVYRKMYKNAAILMGFYFLLGILEAMGVPGGLTGIMQLAVAVTVAMFANHGYRQFVEERVAQIARTTQESAIKAELARQGGTSVGSAIGFAAAMFVLIVFGVLAESL